MSAVAPVTVVIPLKSLHRAKQRLSPALSLAERRRLVLDMYAHVVATCAAVPRIAGIIVVAGDPDTARNAAGRSVTVVADPGHGLNAAVDAADARITTPASLIVAADLPYVTKAELERLLALSDGLVVAADRDAPGQGSPDGEAPGRESPGRRLPASHDVPRLDARAPTDADSDVTATLGCVLVAPTTDGGTGALLRRPHGIIAPAFGPSSCARHLAAGRRVGAVTAVVHLPGLAHDVDRPDDLHVDRSR